MAAQKIDYKQIRKDLITALQADSTLTGITFFHDRDRPIPIPEDGRQCIIYLLDRIPSPTQTIAAGTRQRHMINIELWSYGFSLDSPELAEDTMNDDVALIEIALMNMGVPTGSRLFSAGVQMVTLEGGEFANGKTGDNGFFAGGSIKLKVEAQGVSV